MKKDTVEACASIDSTLEAVWNAVSRPERIFPASTLKTIRFEESTENGITVYHTLIPTHEGGDLRRGSTMSVVASQPNKSITWLQVGNIGRRHFNSRIESTPNGVELRTAVTSEYSGAFTQFLFGTFPGWLRLIFRTNNMAQNYVKNVAEHCSAKFEAINT